MKDKEAIKEKIGIWKEILRAILYAWILEISSTIARLITNKLDLWSALGLIGIIAIGIIYKTIWKRINQLILSMEGD